MAMCSCQITTSITRTRCPAMQALPPQTPAVLVTRSVITSLMFHLFDKPDYPSIPLGSSAACQRQLDAAHLFIHSSRHFYAVRLFVNASCAYGITTSAINIPSFLIEATPAATAVRTAPTSPVKTTSPLPPG